MKTESDECRVCQSWRSPEVFPVNPGGERYRMPVSCPTVLGEGSWSFFKFSANLLSITPLHSSFGAQLRSTHCHFLTYLAAYTSTIPEHSQFLPPPTYFQWTSNHILKLDVGTEPPAYTSPQQSTRYCPSSLLSFLVLALCVCVCLWELLVYFLTGHLISVGWSKYFLRIVPHVDNNERGLDSEQHNMLSPATVKKPPFRLLPFSGDCYE